MIIRGDITELEEGVVNLLTFERDLWEAFSDRLEGTEVATENIGRINEEGEVEIRFATTHEYSGMGIDSFTITLTKEQVKDGDFPNVEEVADKIIKGAGEWI